MSDKIIGIGLTTAGLAGDMPQLNRVAGPQYREKRLFFSERSVALIIQKNVVGGFGELQAGQIMAGIEGANRIIPFGTTMALTDNAAQNGTSIKIDDKYAGMFKVGDSITVADNAVSPTTPEVFTIGEIAIADGKVELKFTGTDKITAASGFTTANTAFVSLTGATTAKYILDQHLDTGDEYKDIGAHASVVLSNAILYSDGIVGLPAVASPNIARAAVLTALGAVEDGPFIILK